MTETTERTLTPRPVEPGGRRARPRSHRAPGSTGWILGLAIGVVVILVAAGVYTLGEYLTTSAPARVTAAVDAPGGGVMPGERFEVSGVVGSPFERPVYLERQGKGSGWSRVETTQTGPGGRYGFPGVRAGEESRFRVVVPAIRHVAKTHPAVTRPLRNVRVVPQRVTEFSVLPGIAQNGDSAADAGAARLVGHATFSPPRKGREVQVQRRLPGGGWERVARDTQGAEGKVSFGLPQDAGSPYQFRVLAQPYDGAPAKPSAAQASNRWQLDFDEQFSLGLDTDRWITRQPMHSPESSRTCAKADPAMVVAGGGVVDLSVARDPAFALDSCEWKNPESGASGVADYYLNAHIGTQGAYSFRYGVAAARVKFQQPRGMHGSFWLQDSGEAEGTLGAEIDTVEFFGEGFSKSGIASFIHTAAGEEVGGSQPDASEALRGPDDTWWDRYHVFSVEWTPDAYVFRIDGVETFRTEEAVSDRQVFVILSLLSSDWELKHMPESGAGTMRVDWVRVWQDRGLADLNR